MLAKCEVKAELKKGTNIDSRYRCQYCGNKLFFDITKHGFSVICPVCQVLTESHQDRIDAIVAGIRHGKIFDLDRFTGNRVQMSDVCREDGDDV